MKKCILLFGLLIVAALSSAAADPIALTYQEGVNGYAGTRDSWMYDALNGRQYGAATLLQLAGDTTNGANRRAVIKFTGLNLPTEALDVNNIVSVKLRMHAAVWEGEGDNISAYGLLKNFNEGAGTGPPDWGNDGVLWEYANWAGYNPPPPTLPWGTPGASATGTVYDTTGAGSGDRLANADDSPNINSTSNGWEGWAEWNVTNSFKNQLTNGKEYGWLLKATGTKYTFINVKSSEYSTDPSLRPQLVVTYNAPVPEPGSLVVLGMGLVSAAGFAIRRRRGA